MRTLEPPNRLQLGMVGVAIVALITVVGQTFTSVPQLFAQPIYYALFHDSGGLNPGDKVRISGVNVGEVQAITIEGDHVKTKFSLHGITIGTGSRLLVRTETILGKKILDIEPKGTQKLRVGAVLPLQATTTPYPLDEAFSDISRAAENWDVKTVKESLQVLIDTIDQTSPHLNAALQGVERFADVIGKRDEQISQLLTQANKIAAVMGNRADQINAIFIQTQALLAAFNQRSAAISVLLTNIATLGQQVRGIINDNPNLTHVLEQLRDVSDVLVKHQANIQDTLVQFGRLFPLLNDAVGSGPYFKTQVVNVLPFWVLQPFVDAAFKKRGINPEEMWRNAGLPSFRYPDPNGTRFPNGAPPPAPPVREGTPDHLGPAVPPGSPCSYAPAAGLFPSPDNPLPCLGLGENGVAYPDGLPDVLLSPPNPNGIPSSPGIPMGGLPGEIPPDVPGIPVPLPQEALPGARTEPIGPRSGPVPGNPVGPPIEPRWMPPPGLPALPGPGDQLPAPFIPPGMGGNSQPGGGGGALEGR